MIAEAPAAELRIAGSDDRVALRAFLMRLSPETVRARYMSSWSSLDGSVLDQEMQRLLDRDTRHHVVLLAESEGDIRGVGEFFVDETQRTAELGLVVGDEFQRRGIGGRLYLRLEELARERGIRAFACDVQWQNHGVQALLRRSGRPLTVRPEYAAGRFTLDLDAGSARNVP